MGGVAHEVRTPLTYAATNLHMLRRDLQRLAPDVALAAEPKLDEMEAALERINGIVRQLRKFARQEVEAQLEEELRDPIRDALRLWRATNAGAANVREDLAPTPPVRVDRGQIQQVVLNLVQNAAEATGPTGSIVVRTLEESGDALLVVEDDGPGMTPETLANLFQPLRTTKRDGLGLGLSIVRGIVQAHRGRIEIDSAPGAGTRVRVRLPRAAEPPGRAP